jgi:hypothetical protein
MKCDKCGYDDKGTGDTAHVCGPVNVMPTVPDNVFKLWADPRFQLLADMDKLLNGSKIWGGMEWSYHPIHPVKYRPVAEKVRAEMDKLKAEYGIEE